VSIEELEEKYNPSDSSASASYLYKYRNTYYKYKQGEGFFLITDIRERVKIYNHDGFKYATEEIRLSKDGANKEKVSGIKANTYNIEGGKIVENKLKKDAIFKTELSKYFDQTKFTLPNIKDGTVIEFKYRVTSPFISNIDEFQFQYGIPVKKLEAIFDAPEYFMFRVNTKGFINVVAKEETKRERIVFTNKNRRSAFSGGATVTKYSTSNADYLRNVSSYNFTNMPALEKEPYVNNINNYRAAVKYELSYTKFPNSIMEHYTITWEDVVKTIYKSPNFGAQLGKSGYYEDDVNNLIADITNPLEKVMLLYNYVKSKVKWNGYNSKYANIGVRKAYKDGVGNVAEINLMLTSMLRYSGLKANPVLVSTRGNGIPLFPTREGYNYVVSSVETPNGVVLLDASNVYASPDILPYRALNWNGRIIKDNGGSTIIDLYPKVKSKKTVSMMMSLIDTGEIEGAIRTVKTAHEAINFRESYLESNNDQFIERLENEYGGIEISDFNVKNALDLSKPVTESYKFLLDNQIDIIGDRMYLSPLLFLNLKENPFKLEKREFPVDYGYPMVKNYRLNIKIPEGYSVESIPKTKAIMLPENLGSYKYNIVANGTTIQLIIFAEINTPIIAPMHYESLKGYFSQIISKENEKIVLKKNEP